MGLADYDELVASIADWSARSDLTAVIPDFILLAEEEINNHRLKCMDKLKTGTFDGVDQIIKQPSDRLVTRVFAIDGSPVLVQDFVSLEVLYRQKDGTETDRPTRVAEFGDELHFAPVPAAGTTYRHYYTQRADLVRQGTNPVLAEFPALYLFGALCKMEAYIKNDPRYPVWRAMLADSWRFALARDEGGRWGSAIPAPRVM